MPLTDLAVRNAKPKATPYKLSDTGGLFLLVPPSGHKRWRYKYRWLGKEKLLSLGVYPEVGLADARERHFAARKALAAGNDPGELKRVSKQQALGDSRNTFEVIARQWHKSRSSRWSSGYADKLMTSLEQDVFPKIGHRPLSIITAADLLAMLKPIQERGAVETAHRVKQTCGQIFMYAIASDKARSNPAVDLAMALQVPQRKNNAYLKESQLPEFIHKLSAYDGEKQTQLAIELLMLTFVRTVELRGAVWTEFDFKKAEWRIPPERMKMRVEHIVPLSRQALAVLEALKKLNADWDHVFPNERKPRTYMSENTVLFALYRMGYRSRATGHGFRATASTILNENRFHRDVIKRQLAHAERNNVRGAYNHAEYLPERREMMQWWADFLDQQAAKKHEKAA